MFFIIQKYDNSQVRKEEAKTKDPNLKSIGIKIMLNLIKITWYLRSELPHVRKGCHTLDTTADYLHQSCHHRK